ncbi:hypothetical protein BGZ46_007286 [Entomortierella lignicola]|nr:hypothetical protein BGZ46_007286 [Entomortierella lignicola]
MLPEYGLHWTSMTDKFGLKPRWTQLSSAKVDEDILTHLVPDHAPHEQLRGDQYQEQLQGETYKQLLAKARAGKFVEYQRKVHTPLMLPNEILIQIFEKLHSDQQTLVRAASVCLEWNLCATVFLYRYPVFASTFHWALFILTLSRTRESKRPKGRSQHSVVQSLSHGRKLDPHQPSQLDSAYLDVYGDRAQSRNSRLDYNLGDFVRGIDLSRKTDTVDLTLAVTTKSQESPTISRPRTTSHSRSIKITKNDTPLRTTLVYLRSNDNVKILARPNNQQAGSAGACSTGHASLIQHSPDQASNQRWSILWSMESQYRKSFGHVRYPAASLRSSVVIPKREYTQNGCSQTPLVHGMNPPSLSNLNEPMAEGSSFSSFVREDDQGEYSDVSNNPEHRVETKEIRYKKFISVTVSSIIQMARHCPKLTSLCLGSSLISDTLYLETDEYQSTLQPGPRKGLTYVPVTIEDSAKALGEHCPKLQKLLLAGCDWVTAVEVKNFALHCRQLQTLDLRHCSKLDGRLAQLFVVDEEPGETARISGYCTDNELLQHLVKRDSISMTTSPEGLQAGTEALLNAVLGADDPTNNTQHTFRGWQSSPSSGRRLDLGTLSGSPFSTDSPSSTELGVLSEVSMSITYKAVRDGAMCDLVNAACSGQIGKVRMGSQEHQENQLHQHIHYNQQHNINGSNSSDGNNDNI